MHRSDKNWLVALLLAAGAAAVLWYFWVIVERPAPEPVPAQPETAPVEAAARSGPMHPLEPLASPQAGDRRLMPLPPLDDIDAYFRLELVNLFGQKLDGLLADETLIDRFVATVDNLPRTHVAERIRPVGRISGVFAVDSGIDDGSFVLSASNYDRYDFLVNMVVTADLGDLVDIYRRYYPILQAAYVRLGYPDGYFNDRVVEVIDHLITTPVPDKPIRLARPHVLYEYADPELEALSSGQKLLLRMGSENAARTKKVLEQLRVHIAQ
jgi:hypothetical protein